jgi:hypothetical protein
MHVGSLKHQYIWRIDFEWLMDQIVQHAPTFLKHNDIMHMSS